MRIIFMGTSTLSARILEELILYHDVVAVFSKKDAIRGRGNLAVASPVKELALEKNIDIYTPENLREDSYIEIIKSYSPDAICVAAYGCLIPKEILDIPKYGCLNVHTSLLPRWRGAAPVERAILAGDEFSGVSIMQMDEGLDTGPYCLQKKIFINDKYIDDLYDEFSEIGAKLLIEVLRLADNNELHWIDQDDNLATYAEKVKKKELLIKLDDSTNSILSKIRISNKSRPAKLGIANKEITILQAQSVDIEDLPEKIDIETGYIAFKFKRLFMQAKDGLIELVSVKPDGKKEMSGMQFASGIQGIKKTKIKWWSV